MLIMSSVCHCIFFTKREREKKKERKENKEKKYTSQYLSLLNSYDHEIFYTFSVLYLPSMKAIFSR